MSLFFSRTESKFIFVVVVDTAVFHHQDHLGQWWWRHMSVKVGKQASLQKLQFNRFINHVNNYGNVIKSLNNNISVNYQLQVALFLFFL